MAKYPSGGLDPKLTWESSCLSNRQHSDQARGHGVGRFIYASSGSVYGIKDEEQVTEDLELLPISEYNKTKMCAEPIRDQHQHVVNLESRALLCTCRGCYLLFSGDAARQSYRAVPERYLSFPGFRLGPAQWSAPGIPVGLAFFFRSSAPGRPPAAPPPPPPATARGMPRSGFPRRSITPVGRAKSRPSFVTRPIQRLPRRRPPWASTPTSAL